MGSSNARVYRMSCSSCRPAAGVEVHASGQRFLYELRVQSIVEFGRNGSQVVIVLFVLNAKVGRESRADSLKMTRYVKLLKKSVEFAIELGGKSVQRFVEVRFPH